MRIFCFLQMLIPIERYLQPEETNTEMMRLYYECLLSLTVRPRWAPVLYLVAVHHVNRFIYTQDNKHTKLKHAMLKEALKGEYKVGLLNLHVLLLISNNVMLDT